MSEVPLYAVCTRAPMTAFPERAIVLAIVKKCASCSGANAIHLPQWMCAGLHTRESNSSHGLGRARFKPGLGMALLPSEGATTRKVFRTFTFKPTPGSGLGCLVCATFALDRETHTPSAQVHTASPHQPCHRCCCSLFSLVSFDQFLTRAFHDYFSTFELIDPPEGSPRHSRARRKKTQKVLRRMDA